MISGWRWERAGPEGCYGEIRSLRGALQEGVNSKGDETFNLDVRFGSNPIH